MKKILTAAVALAVCYRPDLSKRTHGAALLTRTL